MDTTAAAELGDVADGGLGFWDEGSRREPEGWAPVDRPHQRGWGRPGGGDGSMGRPPSNRSHASPGGPMGGIEPPHKRMRHYNGGGSAGVEDGFRMGPGSYNGLPPPQPSGNVPHGVPENGAWGSPAGHASNVQGGSPSIRNDSGGGGADTNFSQSPAPPSSGDQYGQSPGLRGRGTSIFYKTKLCSRFRNGSCPFNTNCNFAHGTEELRTPPPGWEDVAAGQEGGAGGAAGGRSFAHVAGGNGNGGSEGGGVSGSNAQAGAGGGGNWPSNPSSVPNQGSSPAAGGGGGSGEMSRYHRPRPCKKFSTETGCPYGERCIFSHDEAILQGSSKSARDMAAVPGPVGLSGSANGVNSVISGAGGSAGGAGRGGEGGGALGVGGDGSVANGNGETPGHRPPNWKTRLCNKWETTGHCPFGDKCHFAHGSAELQRYGGGPLDGSDGGNGFQMDSKHGPNSGNFGGGDDGFPGYADGGSMRHPSNYSNRFSPMNPAMGPRFSAIWNGPTEGISTIYGDWPDEEE